MYKYHLFLFNGKQRSFTFNSTARGRFGGGITRGTLSFTATNSRITFSTSSWTCCKNFCRTCSSSADWATKDEDFQLWNLKQWHNPKIKIEHSNLVKSCITSWEDPLMSIPGEASRLSLGPRRELLSEGSRNRPTRPAQSASHASNQARSRSSSLNILRFPATSFKHEIFHFQQTFDILYMCAWAVKPES